MEIVQRGDSRWYRIVHGDDLLDWLSIDAVERVLDHAGVDHSTPITVPPQQPAHHNGTVRRTAAG